MSQSEQYTKNKGLLKSSDRFGVEDPLMKVNGNWDIIDNELGNISSDLIGRAINVRFPFGTNLTPAKGDGSNETSILQTIINYASSNKLNVYFPAGTYMADKLIIHSNSGWIGGGQGVTILKASVSAEIGFIKMEDHGPVSKFFMDGFTISGQGSLNPSQNGLHFNAIQQDIPSYTGGLWNSHFYNLSINGFNGNQIYLGCTDGSGDMANQFLTFMNLTVFREDNATSRCLKAEGQFGQVTFIQCEFDGRGQATVGGINVELRSLNSTNDQIYSIKFDTCTFQSSELAITTYYVTNVVFDNAYFENLKYGVSLTNSSYVVLEMPRFANVSNSGTGYCIQSSSASHVIANNVSSFGTIDTVAKNSNGYLEYTVLIGFNTSSGITYQSAIDVNGAISINWNKSILVNSSATNLKTITDKLSTGSMITLIAWGGSVIVNKTGNIQFQDGFTTLTLPNKGTVTLLKTDLGINGWAVIGTTGTFS